MTLSSDEVRLVARLNSESIIDTCRDLVRIATENPPGDEQLATSFLSYLLGSYGFDVTVYENEGRPNVVGTVEASDDGPTLLFNGHVDVVPAGDGWSTDPFGAELRDGRIWGRGAADTKSGLAAGIHGVGAFVSSDLFRRGRVVVAAVADEEARSLGTKALRKAQPTPDAVVVAEPTELRPVIAHKGGLIARIVFRGETAHGSRPELGINAISHAARAVLALEKYGDSLVARKHPLLGAGTINVAMISGGWLEFAVPDECHLTVDRRTLPHERIADVKDEIAEVVRGLEGELDALDVDFEVLFEGPPMDTEEHDGLVRAVRGSVADVEGADPGAHGVQGGTDGGLYSTLDGIPVVVFGPGSIQVAHKPDENVSVDEVTAAAKIYALTAIRYLASDG